MVSMPLHEAVWIVMELWIVNHSLTENSLLTTKHDAMLNFGVLVNYFQCQILQVRHWITVTHLLFCRIGPKRFWFRWRTDVTVTTRRETKYMGKAEPPLECNSLISMLINSRHSIWLISSCHLNYTLNSTLGYNRTCNDKADSTRVNSIKRCLHSAWLECTLLEHKSNNV